jgi:hypothetical protein
LVPPLPRYYGVLRLAAARPTSLRFLRSAVQPSQAETAASPRFLENPRARALLYDPGGAELSPGIADAFSDSGSPHILFAYEAQSHGPHTRCLRFATSVALGHARLASGCTFALTGRGWLPAGFLREDFRFVSVHRFLLSQTWPGAPKTQRKMLHHAERTRLLIETVDHSRNAAAQ